LAPEADAFEPPPAPGSRPTGGEPSLLEAGLSEPGLAPLPEGRAPADQAAGRESGRRGRRRGGRHRRGREREQGGPRPDGARDDDAPPVPGDGLTAEAGAELPAPDPDAGPPGAAARAEPREPREPRGPRGRERRGRRERRPERSERRPERGERRPRQETDLPEVHEAPLPQLEEGEEPLPPAPKTGPVVKTLLINAADPEEVRIAMLEDGKLEEIYLETGHERSAAGNVYRGRVQNVERGIGAAFVDLGRGLMGFLHATDLPDIPEGKEDAPITELIQPGQEVLVQITRDSIGRKGPALSGRIALPGRYLVLMPNSDRSGVSRRIGRGGERDRMRRLMSDLEVPEGMGLIVRTAGESQPLALLRADLKHLIAEWEALKTKAAEAGIPGLLRGESDVAERCVRDIMPADTARLIVDDPRMAERIRELLDVWYPQSVAPPPEPAAPAPELAAPPVEHAAPTVEPAAPAVEPADTKPVRAPARARVPVSAPPPPVDEFAAGLLAPSPGTDESPSDEPALAPEPPALAEVADAAPPVEPDGDAEAPGPEPEHDEVRGAAHAASRAEPALPKPPEVEPWSDPMPLFHAQGVETQLEDALRRMIRLPSGGSIVVDPTEALVAIDVNSGRLTGEEDPEKTALVTNLEAVAEATRQLRLRDLGGLIVIDFIDMRDRKAGRQVERALRMALARDRARIRVDRIGPFGCVMLSRQRIRQALSRVTHEECAVCAGTGRRRLLSGLALRVLREMQARVARSRGRGGLEVRAPVAVVEWIKKHRSTALRDLKQVCTGPVRLEADVRLAPDGWAMKGLAPDGSALSSRLPAVPPAQPGAVKP
jgi:Ribonuclease G/E